MTKEILFWIWSLLLREFESSFFIFDCNRIFFDDFEVETKLLISPRILVPNRSGAKYLSILERGLYATNISESWTFWVNILSFLRSYFLKVDACQRTSPSKWILAHYKEKERFFWKIVFPWTTSITIFHQNFSLLICTHSDEFDTLNQPETCG